MSCGDHDRLLPFGDAGEQDIPIPRIRGKMGSSDTITLSSIRSAKRASRAAGPYYNRHRNHVRLRGNY